MEFRDYKYIGVGLAVKRRDEDVEAPDDLPKRIEPCGAVGRHSASPAGGSNPDGPCRGSHDPSGLAWLGGLQPDKPSRHASVPRCSAAQVVSRGWKVVRHGPNRGEPVGTQVGAGLVTGRGAGPRR